jgi:biopolymer transport protein TolR
MFLQNDPIADDQLVPRLEAITKANPNADIYVRGDQAINYGRVMQIMGMVSAAGYQKVSLITEPVQSGGTAAAAPPKTSASAPK